MRTILLALLIALAIFYTSALNPLMTRQTIKVLAQIEGSIHPSPIQKSDSQNSAKNSETNERLKVLANPLNRSNKYLRMLPTIPTTNPNSSKQTNPQAKSTKRKGGLKTSKTTPINLHPKTNLKLKKKRSAGKMHNTSLRKRSATLSTPPNSSQLQNSRKGIVIPPILRKRRVNKSSQKRKPQLPKVPNGISPKEYHNYQRFRNARLSRSKFHLKGLHSTPPAKKTVHAEMHAIHKRMPSNISVASNDSVSLRKDEMNKHGMLNERHSIESESHQPSLQTLKPLKKRSRSHNNTSVLTEGLNNNSVSDDDFSHLHTPNFNPYSQNHDIKRERSLSLDSHLSHNSEALYLPYNRELQKIGTNSNLELEISVDAPKNHNLINEKKKEFDLKLERRRVAARFEANIGMHEYYKTVLGIYPRTTDMQKLSERTVMKRIMDSLYEYFICKEYRPYDGLITFHAKRKIWPQKRHYPIGYGYNKETNWISNNPNHTLSSAVSGMGSYMKSLYNKHRRRNQKNDQAMDVNPPSTVDVSAPVPTVTQVNDFNSEIARNKGFANAALLINDYELQKHFGSKQKSSDLLTPQSLSLQNINGNTQHYSAKSM